jgi:hypothetical protein
MILKTRILKGISDQDLAVTGFTNIVIFPVESEMRDVES